MLGPTCLCRLCSVVLGSCNEFYGAVLRQRAELLAAGTVSLLQAGAETQPGVKTEPRDLDVGGSVISLEGRCASTFEDLVVFPKASRRLWKNEGLCLSVLIPLE